MAVPLFNPDLFWHLNAGRWIWANGTVPRSDPFSFTAGGQPWLDFEWLFQVVVYAVHSLMGFWGLRLLKAELLAFSFFFVDRLLRRRGVGAGGRGLALAFWAAAVLPQSDLRPDLFSALFFAWLLSRLDEERWSWRFSLPLFALWSNLHAGFALGLCLYAAKLLSLLRERRPLPRALWLEAAVALPATCLNPLGPEVWKALFLHGEQAAAIGRYVQEWGALSWRMPLQWPLLAALLAFSAGVLHRRRQLPPFLALVAIPLAVATAFSVRFGLFFAAAGAALLFTLGGKAAPRHALPALAALSALMAWPLARVPWLAPFAETYVARRAVDFVAEKPELKGLRLFNTYEWGGYLGWRRPGEPVFGDGRYLFHGQLPELESALRTAPDMAAFVERHRLDGLLIKNYPDRLPSTRLYKDGSSREFMRPWHVFLLPRERWALVYFDEQALLFVDRSKVPSAWLAAHEFRWLRPGDEEAFSDALRRGEIPPDALDAESRRAAALLR